MTAPPLPPPILNTHHALLETLVSFLTASIHTILFTRSIYPARTFITARKYNLPVHQSRHPAVCAWINNAMAGVHDLLLRSTVQRVVVVIYSEQGEVMERYMFDLERFPIVDKTMAWAEFEDRPGSTGTTSAADSDGNNGDNGDNDMENPFHAKDIPLKNLVDIEEQLRATLLKLDLKATSLAPLPPKCTYTVAVELRKDPGALPPIGHPQPWIPAEPSLQTGEKGGSEVVGKDLGGVRAQPVRLIEAGEFILETWIEEGKAKFPSGPD